MKEPAASCAAGIFVLKSKGNQPRQTGRSPRVPPPRKAAHEQTGADRAVPGFPGVSPSFLFLAVHLSPPVFPLSRHTLFACRHPLARCRATVMKGFFMLLFYIRHGEPIYDPNQLTPLGERQAEAL